MTATNPNNLAPVSNYGEPVVAGRMQALAPISVAVDLHTAYPEAELTKLLGSLGHMLADHACPAIHFISAYEGEGGGDIAFETALAAARQSGKRTLFLNMNSAPGKSYLQLSQKALVSIDAYFRAESPHGSPLLSVHGTSLFYADFSKSVLNLASVLDTSFLRALIQGLKENFDLIVISSSGAMLRSAPSMLCPLVDGNVLVIEAERTRSPVAEALKNQVESGGGRVLGAVLNRRQFHIPYWIYKRLFGHQGR